MGCGAGRCVPGRRGHARLTTLHLIRHASHSLLGHTLAGRMAGVLLSEEGHAQAARLADALAGVPLAAVISSPLERAQQTAAPIAARHNLMVQTDPAVNEIEFGAWTGCRFDELAGPEWDAWNQNRGVAPVPGGETMLAAQARAMAAVQRWAALYPAGEVAVVSHQDILKAVVALVLGVPLDLLHRFDLGPASRSVLRIGAGWARIEGINLGAGC